LAQQLKIGNVPLDLLAVVVEKDKLFVHLAPDLLNGAVAVAVVMGCPALDLCLVRVVAEQAVILECVQTVAV
jgi:hypothetical protein